MTTQRSEVLADVAQRELDPGPSVRVPERFLGEVDGTRPRQRRLAGLAASLAVFAAVMGWRWPSSPATVPVQSSAQSYVASTEPLRLPLRGPGSIELGGLARATVDEGTMNQTAVVVQAGRVDVTAQLNGDHEWVVTSGEVETRCAVGRFAAALADGRVRLEVFEGEVQVRSPSFRGTLSAGQHLDVEPARAALGELPPPAPPSVAPRPVRAVVPEPSPGPRTALPALSLEGLVAKGRFAQALEQGRAAGPQFFTTSSVTALAAFADAARYQHDLPTARHALETLRARFPTSAQAQHGAWLLGRLSEDEAQPAVALQWYEVYAREAPNGPLAAEALGRRLLLTPAGEADARCALAREYLSRFPAAPLAGRASAICGAAAR